MRRTKPGDLGSALKLLNQNPGEPVNLTNTDPLIDSAAISREERKWQAARKRRIAYYIRNKQRIDQNRRPIPVQLHVYGEDGVLEEHFELESHLHSNMINWTMEGCYLSDPPPLGLLLAIEAKERKERALAAASLQRESVPSPPEISLEEPVDIGRSARRPGLRNIPTPSQRSLEKHQ